METCDRSYEFIKRVEGCFDYSASAATFEKRKSSGMDDVKRLQQMFGIEDIMHQVHPQDDTTVRGPG